MATFDIPHISFGGLATGLDTNAIISSLVAVEHLPIDLMTQNKIGYEAKISAFGTLKTHLKSLQTAADGLKDEKDFNVFKTSVSLEGILSASASKYAAPGTYQIEVQSLATFEQVSSQQYFADKEAPQFGIGSMLIQVGSDDPIEVIIDDSNNSLEGLAQAINGAEAGVTALVVDDGQGNGTPQYHLVISSNSTGANHGITLDTSGLAGGTALGGFDVNQTGQDAHFSVNGMDLYRPSNTVTDVAPGLSFDLTGVTSGGPVSLTVSRDAEAIAEKVEALVEAYNEVIGFINAQNTYSEDAETGGILMGESLLLRVQNRLQSILVPGWNTDPGAPEIQILAQVGVSFQDDGTLSVNSEELKAAIEGNFDDVKAMFSKDSEVEGEMSGFGDEIEALLKEYTQVEGFVDSTNKNFQSLVKSLNDQIADAEDRLEGFEATLIKKFAALESLMAGLQSQQSFLSNLQLPSFSG